MSEFDLSAWVGSAKAPDLKFRQAVHTILHAISRTPVLREVMAIKGGVLLALRYRSPRFTKDIDFSTSDLFRSFDKDSFLASFQESLAVAVESLGYNLDCRVQSHTVNPSREDATFQTMAIRIGYAQKASPEHKKLIALKCPSIVSIDYSFNEQSIVIDAIAMEDGGILKAYSLPDLVAEKYRSIIQQIHRNRNRRQDAYDIYWLLRNDLISLEKHGPLIISSLKMKSAARDIIPSQHSLRDEGIVHRSKHDYLTLAAEIEGELPPFDEVYSAVRAFYESLPWDMRDPDWAERQPER